VPRDVIARSAVHAPRIDGAKFRHDIDQLFRSPLDDEETKGTHYPPDR
jgi:hypothetical protein